VAETYRLSVWDDEARAWRLCYTGLSRWMLRAASWRVREDAAGRLQRPAPVILVERECLAPTRAG
jgi:hypothetical protein